MSTKGPSSSNEGTIVEVPSTPIYSSYEEQLVEHLLNTPHQDNRLSLIEALRNHQEDPLSEKQIMQRIAEQASFISTHHDLTKKYAKKGQIINEFIQVLRSKMPDTAVTPELVKTALLALKEQFESKARTRVLVVAAAEKVSVIENEIIRLEKEAKAAGNANSAASAANAAPLPNTTPLELARNTLETAKKALADTMALYKKPTDIHPDLESHFKAFVQHLFDPKHKMHLDVIVSRVQFCRPEANGKLEEAVAQERWKKVTDGRAKRLEDEDKGVFSGIQAAVTYWNKNMPKALSTAQWQEREQQIPYVATQEGKAVADEPRDKRDERRKQIRSLQFVSDLNEEKRVVRVKEAEAKASATSQLKAARKAAKDPMAAEKLRQIDFHPIARRPHEAEDSLREEFEILGIKQIPGNKQYKQSMASASWNYFRGNEVWNTDFESRNPHVPLTCVALVDGKPSPLTRATFDPEPLKHAPREPGKDPLPAPKAYPPRRDYHKAALAPALQRHLELGVKKGYLVGRIKDVKTDKYWEPVKDSDEMTDVINRLGGMKI